MRALCVRGRSMRMRVILVALVWEASRASIVPSTLSCDDLESCSPEACVVSDDEDCSFNSNPPDFVATIASVSCRSCAQSTVGFACAAPGSALKTDAGIKAAYCTDEFLVVWATGKPRYEPGDEDYLGSIPLPPGGSSTCRVRTSAELLTVYKIPLSPPVDQDGTNDLPEPLPGVAGMPAAGAIAMALDGVPMFPNYNNRGQAAAVSCEIDRCNARARVRPLGPALSSERRATNDSTRPRSLPSRRPTPARAKTTITMATPLARNASIRPRQRPSDDLRETRARVGPPTTRASRTRPSSASRWTATRFTGGTLPTAWTARPSTSTPAAATTTTPTPITIIRP